LSALLLLGTTAHAEDQAKPVEFGAVWTSDLTSVTGGLRRGGLMMHNLDLTAHWQGSHGWEAFGYVLEDFNGGLSSKYIGDTQVTSNIDTPPAAHLFEAYVRKTSADQTVTTTFGLINLNGIFDVQDVGSLFLNASHGIGPDYSQSGPSIFPVSALGAVGEWHVNDKLILRGGVFDGVPGDANDPSRFAYIRLAKDEGAHLIAEGEYDGDGVVLKLGHWTDTVAVSRLDGMGTQHMSGTYGQAQFTLTQEADHADQGLKAWLRAGVASKQTLAVDQYIGGGLVYAGPLPGRDDDFAGFAIAQAHFGAPYRATVASLAAETTYELSYQAAIRPGLSLEPDVQYVVHPGGTPGVKNATVIGVRLKLDLLAR
ncbi:MAG TPA: carbohydrate porin, partial [Asticcacaulis sp.]|nr:carbohydrate porin [Asticcacaulis sp.]